MNLGLNKIDWCAQVTYLSVVINTGKSISLDITETKRHFFIACNSIFSSASKTNELLHLSLQEMYSLPISLYTAPVVTFSSRQLRTLAVGISFIVEYLVLTFWNQLSCLFMDWGDLIYVIFYGLGAHKFIGID
jgi:hypothetical protein